MMYMIWLTAQLSTVILVRLVIIPRSNDCICFEPQNIRYSIFQPTQSSLNVNKQNSNAYYLEMI